MTTRTLLLIGMLIPASVQAQWLDSAKTRSVRYRPLAKQFFWIFVGVCLGLGYLGAKPPEGVYVVAGRILTACYFAYFLIVLPILSRIEKPRAVPNSIADDVLGKKKVVASALAVFSPSCEAIALILTALSSLSAFIVILPALSRANRADTFAIFTKSARASLAVVENLAGISLR